MRAADTHEAIAQSVSQSTLRDIEAYDAAEFGFGREECCGPVPGELAGSFKPLTQHVFVSSDLPATQWDKQAANVDGYTALGKALKAEGTQVTAFHRPGPDSCILQFRWDEKLATTVITQFSCTPPGEVPWECPSAVAVNRSNEVFIFVCSHGARDGRCGYCGTVLVDLLRQAVAAKLGADAAVHVFPCSHVGGHVYAGNVLVYSKTGGVCFGCFRPSDVEPLVISLQGGDMAIPSQLLPRVRGRMGGAAAGDASGCGIM